MWCLLLHWDPGFRLIFLILFVVLVVVVRLLFLHQHSFLLFPCSADRLDGEDACVRIHVRLDTWECGLADLHPLFLDDQPQVRISIETKGLKSILQFLLFLVTHPSDHLTMSVLEK